VVGGGAGFTAVRVERDLERRGCAAVTEAGLDGIALSYSGRTAVVAGGTGDVRTTARAVTALFDVRGTRDVDIVPAVGAGDAACVLPAGAAASGSGRTAGDPAAQAPDGALVTVLFDTNSSDLDREARSTLDAFLVWLDQQPDARLQVWGHADNTGLDTRNLPLSRKRAESVAAHLVAEGVDPGRLTTGGAGSVSPAFPNTTRDGRRLNRRVEILLEVPS
jgi:outer membrane protein OmpA-like peptidoglycan-associated protein